MTPEPIFDFIIAFAGAVIYATFAEYVLHRMMHAGLVLAEQHAAHHEQGISHGWLEEFLNYFLPAQSILWVGFLYSPGAGAGFAAGGTLAIAWAAYAHQIQHENPELVFWLARPVHHLHHKFDLQHTNFGISVDWWDRIFGTYYAGDWEPGENRRSFTARHYLNIQWHRS